MPAPTLILLHFTRNLRLAANPALNAALRFGLPVAGVFVWPQHANPRQQTFLRQTLAELSDGLAAHGIPLHVLHGSAADALNGLMARHPSARLVTAQAVRLAGSEAANRVLRIQEEILAVPVMRHGADAAPPPDFSVFRQAWLRQAQADDGADGEPDWAAAERIQRGLPEELRDVPPLPDAPDAPLLQQGGETAAQAAWHAFLPKLALYPLLKDLPAQKGTSQLSAALRFGLLPVRALAREALRQDAPQWLEGLVYADYCRRKMPFSDGLWTWENGGLREILPSAPPPETPAADSARSEALSRWQRGETGVPLVDAAMRSLVRSGWLHPRLRLLCAAFPAALPDMPAAAAERFFADTLADYDPALCRAGCREAAAGRLKNPFVQSQHLDPDGRFIRSHLPELAHLDSSLIHAPHRAGSGIERNGYPAPTADF